MYNSSFKMGRRGEMIKIEGMAAGNVVMPTRGTVLMLKMFAMGASNLDTFVKTALYMELLVIDLSKCDWEWQHRDQLYSQNDMWDMSMC